MYKIDICFIKKTVSNNKIRNITNKNITSNKFNNVTDSLLSIY